MADEKIYVEYDAIIKAIHDDWDDVCNWDASGSETADEVERSIACVPAADVAPVRHGRWKQVKPQVAVCSACGHPWTTNGRDMTGNANIFNALYHFCPNCGADCRGDANGE